MKKFLLCSLLTILTTTIAQAEVITMLALGGAESPVDVLVERFNSTIGKEKNIEVVLESRSEILQKVLDSGDAQGFDVILVGDAGQVGNLSAKNITGPFLSEKIKNQIPAHLRNDTAGHIMLTKRARIIYYNPAFVSADEVENYEDLSNPKFFGKLCLRNSAKMYNTSLVSFFLSVKGEEATRSMLKSWIENNAVVKQKDTDVVKSVASGECLVGVANTYYLAAVQREMPNLKIGVSFPNKSSYGTHINGKFAGIVRTTEHQKASVTFLEWFSGEEALQIFTDKTNEFPANPKAGLSVFLQSLGHYQENTTFIFDKATFEQSKALELAKSVGWN